MEGSTKQTREPDVLATSSTRKDGFNLAALWIFVGFTLLSLAAGFLYGTLKLLNAPAPSFSAGAPQKRSRRAAGRPTGLCRLAGSGSNLPLTRKLARAFTASNPSARLVVHQSIGSRGGIQAAGDGSVEIGLISRPLMAKEKALELLVVPYAAVAVVVAANSSVPESKIASKELFDIYLGRKTRWSDDSRVVLLQRELGDSSHEALVRRLPGFAEVVSKARVARRWNVLFSDAAMQEGLVAIPGSVGLFDLGAIRCQRLPIKVLVLDTFHPSDSEVSEGRYPFIKELAFVMRPSPVGLTAAFIRFVLSEQGRKVISDNGYIPLPTVKR